MLGRRDWMPAHRSRTERILANRNLKNGALILYDVSSSFLEGSFGTVAVKVLPGNVSDPSMAVAQVNKAPHLLRHRPCGAGRGTRACSPRSAACIRDDLESSGFATKVGRAYRESNA